MMRYVVLSLSIVALGGCQQAGDTSEPAEPAAAPPETAATDSTDAVAVAPDHYKVEHENDQVRVLRITYAAGDETPMHSHPNGVAVFLADQNAEFRLPDGTSEERPTKANDALWIPAETHSPKALSDISLVLVELKGEGGELVLADPAKDSTMVAPDHYKVEFENDQVRVLRIAYADGDKTAMHTHPEAVGVFLKEMTGEFELADGTIQERQAKAGDALLFPAETHSPKASGETSVVLVELKGGGEGE
jgi:quercetin dioxygenase-like cupin family protein